MSSSALIPKGFAPLIILFAIAIFIFLGVASNFHFVLTEGGFHIVKKEKYGLSETFLDTTDWDVFDWEDHSYLRDVIDGDE